MARLRQLNPGNYSGSGKISEEFESVIRYLNAAEFGNKTLAELLDQLFNDAGEWEGPIELRLDTTNGLQYRVGTYTDPEAGWLAVAPVSLLQGPAGTNVGTIEGPLFFNVVHQLSTGGQTVFPYTFDPSTATVMVFRNGLLQRPNPNGAYDADPNTNTITFGAGLNVNDLVTVYSIRSQSVNNFRRSDLVASTGQAVFPFPHTADESLLVFRNGLIQRAGGGFDYIASSQQGTITFTTSLALNELVTVMTVDNQALKRVAGLMLQDGFCNSSGLIRWNKIAVANDEIPQAKVNGLAAGLNSKAKITVSSSTPIGPVNGDFWLDTSQAVPFLKFFHNSQWFLTSPASSVPNFSQADAGKYLRVNGNGVQLEFQNIDFSALVPKTFMGAANGVPTLDSTGKIPATQLPAVASADTIPLFVSGAVANGTYLTKRIYRQRIRIDGLTARLSAGTATIQVSIDGVAVGVTQAVSGTPADVNFGTAIEVDGRTTSKRVEIVVTSQAGAQNLEVGLAIVTLAG